jgi:hypothetical protein
MQSVSKQQNRYRPTGGVKRKYEKKITLFRPSVFITTGTWNCEKAWPFSQTLQMSTFFATSLYNPTDTLFYTLLP